MAATPSVAIFQFRSSFPDFQVTWAWRTRQVTPLPE
jgi:hypothetical protein